MNAFYFSLPHGVTVAQLTLDQFVKVRILVRQPHQAACLHGRFCISNTYEARPDGTCSTVHLVSTNTRGALL